MNDLARCGILYIHVVFLLANIEIERVNNEIILLTLRITLISKQTYKYIVFTFCIFKIVLCEFCFQPAFTTQRSSQAVVKQHCC